MLQTYLIPYKVIKQIEWMRYLLESQMWHIFAPTRAKEIQFFYVFWQFLKSDWFLSLNQGFIWLSIISTDFRELSNIIFPSGGA